jgi:hypothetical protein
MKKFILAVALIAVATACDPTPKKCSDLGELQEAVLNGSTDTAKYDLNGDGEITIADVNHLLAQQGAKTQIDSITVDSTSVNSVK